jgi:hypothetical protein
MKISNRCTKPFLSYAVVISATEAFDQEIDGNHSSVIAANPFLETCAEHCSPLDRSEMFKTDAHPLMKGNDHTTPYLVGFFL